jgi:hypothetical protein
VIRLSDYAPNGYSDCFVTFLRFPEGFKRYVEQNTARTGKPSVSGYAGEALADFVPFDFDHEQEPEKALQDVRRAIRVWEVRWDLPLEALRIGSSSWP